MTEQKRSRGRPPIKDPKCKRYEIRLTESQYETLKDFSKYRNIPISEIINKGIMMYLDTMY